MNNYYQTKLNFFRTKNKMEFYPVLKSRSINFIISFYDSMSNNNKNNSYNYEDGLILKLSHMEIYKMIEYIRETQMYSLLHNEENNTSYRKLEFFHKFTNKSGVELKKSLTLHYQIKNGETQYSILAKDISKNVGNFIYLSVSEFISITEYALYCINTILYDNLLYNESIKNSNMNSNTSRNNVSSFDNNSDKQDDDVSIDTNINNDDDDLSEIW